MGRCSLVASTAALACVLVVIFADEWPKQTQALVSFLAAVATTLVAMIAVLRDTVRFRLLGTRLRLEYDPTDIDMTCDRKRVFYHLTIRQDRDSWLDWLSSPLPLRNCRVLLRMAEGDGIDGSTWSRFPNPEIQFCWPLDKDTSEPNPRSIVYGSNVKVDLGELTKDGFTPRLYGYRDKFDKELGRERWGCIRANKAVTYHAYCLSDEYGSPECDVFRVHWNGTFPKSREEAAQHVTIEKVPSEKKQQALLCQVCGLLWFRGSVGA